MIKIAFNDFLSKINLTKQIHNQIEKQFVKYNTTINGNKIINLSLGSPDSFDNPTIHQQSTIGITLRTGPSYEAKPGISYLIAKAAFQIFESTGLRHRTLIEHLRESTTIFDSQLNRDSMFYAFSCQNQNDNRVDDLLKTFLELINRPIDSQKLFDELIVRSKQEMKFLRETQFQKDPSFYLHNHLLYQTAFKETSRRLSMPLIYEDKHFDQINYSDLIDHQNQYHSVNSNNINIISIGYDDKKIENVLTEYQTKKCGNGQNIVINDFNDIFYDANSGICLQDVDLSMEESNMNSLPEQAHVTIAFPLPFHPTRYGNSQVNMKNFVTQMVYQTLFGGGSSFSSGGPGKGLHSKLYSDCLGRYNWLWHLSCQLSPSSSFNNGFLIIHSSTEPHHLDRLMTFLSIQLLPMLYRPILGEKELIRSKNQLKLNISLRMEHVPEIMEQLATNILHYGRWFDIDEIFGLIDQVTIEDVKQFGKLIIKSPASFLAIGNLKNLGDIEQFFKNQRDLIKD